MASPFYNGTSELTILFTFPNLSESGGSHRAKFIMTIFVETAGYNAPVPRNDTTVPHLPTMIDQPVFDTIGAITLLFVTGVFFYGGDQWRSLDRKSTRLNSSHVKISYAVFC